MKVTLPALLLAFITLFFVSFLNIHSPVQSTVVSSLINDSTQKDTTHGYTETNEHGLLITSTRDSSMDDNAHVGEEISGQILERKKMALSEYLAAGVPIHANEIGVANPRNQTAIPCQGKRIAIIGSSHGRSLAFLFCRRPVGGGLCEGRRGS